MLAHVVEEDRLVLRPGDREVPALAGIGDPREHTDAQEQAREVVGQTTLHRPVADDGAGSACVPCDLTAVFPDVADELGDLLLGE